MYKALAEHLLVDYYSFRVKKVEKEVRNLARKAFIFPILPGVEEGWKAIFYSTEGWMEASEQTYEK